MNEPSLRVTVMGARDLRGVDMGKTSDPYCMINGVRNGYMRSSVQKKNNSPSWCVTLDEDGLKGRDEVAKGAYRNKPVEVCVYDWNKFMKHALLGRVRIDITDLAPEIEHSLNVPLMFDESDKSKFPAQGTLLVRVRYHDPRMPAELMKQYHEQVHLGEERLQGLYRSYNEARGRAEEIRTPAVMCDVLRGAGMLQQVIAAWQNVQIHEVDKLCTLPEMVEAVAAQIFNTLDQDHSETISFAELVTGVSIILEGSNTEKMYRFRFKATDLNNDGGLSFEEAKRLSGMILSIVGAALGTALTQTAAQFKEAGASEKDLKELRESFQRILRESNLATKETEILFQFADRDKNGTISEEEYVAYMLDKEAQAKREKAFAKVVGPACKSLGVALGTEIVLLGNRIKARYGR